MAISQIPALKFIFHSFSESSTFGRPGLGRSTHPHQMAISQIPALLWKLIFVRPSVGRSTPTHQWWFHRFLLWQLTSLRAQYLADQVLADLPPHQMAILQIPALLWEPIFSRPPCWIVISQIPGLSGHYSESSTLGITGLGRSTPFIRWQFHRFHRFHSYSKSSTFGWPSVGRSIPHNILIS